MQLTGKITTYKGQYIFKIPDKILKAFHAKVGDKVDVKAANGGIVITFVK